MANPTEQDIQKDAEKIFKDSIAEVLPKILKQIKSTEPVPVVLDGKAYKEITKEEQEQIAATGETTLVRKGFAIIGTNPKTKEETQSGSLTQNYWESRMLDGVKDAVRAKVTGAAKPVTALEPEELLKALETPQKAPQEASPEVQEAVTKIYIKGMSGYEAHINSNREKPVTGIFKDAVEAIEKADHEAKGIPVKARAAEPQEDKNRLPDDKFNPIKRISDAIRRGATDAAAAISGSGVKILGIEPIDTKGNASPLIPVQEAPEKPKTLDDLQFVNPKTGKPVDPRTGKPKDNHGVKINPRQEPDAGFNPDPNQGEKGDNEKPPQKSRPDHRDIGPKKALEGQLKPNGKPLYQDGKDMNAPPPSPRNYGPLGPVTEAIGEAAKDIMQSSGIGPAVDAISNGLYRVAAPLITPPKKLTPEQQEGVPLENGLPKKQKPMER